MRLILPFNLGARDGLFPIRHPINNDFMGCLIGSSALCNIIANQSNALEKAHPTPKIPCASLGVRTTSITPKPNYGIWFYNTSLIILIPKEMYLMIVSDHMVGPNSTDLALFLGDPAQYIRRNWERGKSARCPPLTPLDRSLLLHGTRPLHSFTVLSLLITLATSQSRLVRLVH